MSLDLRAADDGTKYFGISAERFELLSSLALLHLEEVVPAAAAAFVAAPSASDNDDEEVALTVAAAVVAETERQRGCVISSFEIGLSPDDVYKITKLTSTGPRCSQGDISDVPSRSMTFRYSLISKRDSLIAQIRQEMPSLSIPTYLFLFYDVIIFDRCMLAGGEW